jgi:hypothetical protein
VKTKAALAVLASFCVSAFGQDNGQKPPDWDNYQANAQAKAQADQAAKYRDDRHDNRYKTDPNTSWGIDPQKGQANVRHTY